MIKAAQEDLHTAEIILFVNAFFNYIQNSVEKMLTFWKETLYGQAKLCILIVI